MKYKHIIFTSILAMNTLYGMDKKKHTPQLQIITENTTPITFKKKTHPFNHWMLNKRNTIFGENRFFEYIDKHKGLTLTKEVNIPSDNHTSIHLAYISNLEKRYINHEKFVMLGAFLVYDSRILVNNHIKVLTDYYSQKIPKRIRPPKVLSQKEITTTSFVEGKKETQERGSVIMQDLFQLIEDHGKPEDLLVVITEEDFQLALGNSLEPSSEPSPNEQPKTPKKRHSLSRRPSGLIPKLSTRKSTIRKPKSPRDDKTTDS
jgi:hypothetical protein